MSLHNQGAFFSLVTTALLLGATVAAAQAPPATDIYLAPLEMSDGGVEVGKPVNVTDRAGYDNQPAFLGDGDRLLYTAIGDDGQADIWIYELESRTYRRLTETPESEYSPTPIPGEDAISVVRVEADERQRLWRFPLDGGAPDLLLPDVEPVGYHAWGGPRDLLLFVLGEPNTLQHARRGPGPGKVLAENVGRALHRVPGSPALSFVHKEGEDRWAIQSLELATGKTATLLATRPGREDFAWSPSGKLWTGDGSALYVADPGPDGAWLQVADFAGDGLSEISRIAIHPGNKWIAFVALPGSPGPYLGQKPPGPEPQLFAPGIVSTGRDELNAVFSPDGSLFLFTVKLPGRARHTLLFMQQGNGGWSPPRVLPFSGVYNDADPAFSIDGRSVYFISKRPLTASESVEKDWDIWVVQRTEDGWAEPQNLGSPVNSDQLEVYPSLTRDGTLYYSSGRPGGMGRSDLYRAEAVDGRFSEPENLGGAVNSEYSEGDVYVAPDESYVIFTSARPGNFGSSDLYVSFRMSDGTWSPARNMGPSVNSKYQEYCPVVSPDGKYFFFTSYKPGDLSPGKPLTYDAIQEVYEIPQNGLGDVYWMDTALLDRLRRDD